MNHEVRERILTLYNLLDGHFAYEPHWWPIFSEDRPFEVIVGSVFVQQTRWEAVEAAVQRLIARGWLSPTAIAAADTTELAALIRPCAFHTQKAAGLQAICRYLLERYAGESTMLLAKERQALRSELLALPRIGRETADAIMLYGGQHPVFIPDAYARRLFARVGIAPEFDFLRAPYDAVQEFVEQAIAGHEKGQQHIGSCPAPIAGVVSLHSFYWRFHAQITEACIHHCLTKPRCDRPGARRHFVDPRKCAEHCLTCTGCPLRQICDTYAASSQVA